MIEVFAAVLVFVFAFPFVYAYYSLRNDPVVQELYEKKEFKKDSFPPDWESGSVLERKKAKKANRAKSNDDMAARMGMSLNYFENQKYGYDDD
jgi:hypothetical protein